MKWLVCRVVSLRKETVCIIIFVFYKDSVQLDLEKETFHRVFKFRLIKNDCQIKKGFSITGFLFELASLLLKKIG